MSPDRWSFKLAATVGALVCALVGAACGGNEPTAQEPPTRIAMSEALADREPASIPEIRIVAPPDGAVVSSPVMVTVEMSGIQAAAAGATVDGEGHLHVMVDTDCLHPGEVIPSNEDHVHWGDGSTSKEVELDSGVHRLCVQVADGFHTAVRISDVVTITVD